MSQIRSMKRTLPRLHKLGMKQRARQFYTSTKLSPYEGKGSHNRNLAAKNIMALRKKRV